jgi:hypothetical protein
MIGYKKSFSPEDFWYLAYHAEVATRRTYV